MSYTPTSWSTGDTITATAMNKIEAGIANAGGSSWDAVIRLTHGDNTGPDNYTSLTPSIEAGTFAELSAKITNDGCPCILVEYKHAWGMCFAVPMAYINTSSNVDIEIDIIGYSVMAHEFKSYGTLLWDNNDTIEWTGY